VLPPAQCWFYDGDVKMRAGGTIETSLVAAARAGDPRAMDDLVAASLPLVYTIVRRALNGDPDADDVVQDVMLRAFRQLPTLHKPESFRSWLTAIAVNQVSTHLRRRTASAGRAAPLDAAAAMPDPGAEVEGRTVLQLELSAQRRQVIRAGDWLDPDDRVLLSLWLLETAGELTRADLAAALGTSVAHAGVRIQRMRQQLDLSRELVAALDARPRCVGLDAAAADWDRTPTPLWRKRLNRHTRSCPVCKGLASTIVPAERLLPAIVLLPVPIGLTTTVLGKTAAIAPAALTGLSSAAAAGASTASTGAGVKAGLLGQLLQSVLAHPIAASVAIGALATGAAVTATLPAASPPSPGTIAAPAPTNSVRTRPPSARPVTSAPRPPASTAARPDSAGTVSLVPGRLVSLESADDPGTFVTTADGLGILTAARSTSDYTVRRQATFTAIAGLADPDCFTFRAPDGRYLRHASWRLRLDPNQGTPLFRSDATFCIGNGATAGTVTLESSNYPGWYLHHRGSELWVDQTDGGTAFHTEASFRLRPALAS
jgi:RNA polymerase sigma factor (sigma-70 family)